MTYYQIKPIYIWTWTINGLPALFTALLIGNVTRIEARSHNLDMFMHLDVDTEVYPLAVGDKFTRVMAPTLNLDGTSDTGYYTPITKGAKKTLAGKYECVMHGKLYISACIKRLSRYKL
ncbi:unnamed protein product [Eruca vesicaria subsp. sativa]|uniref:Uncharacterized protein n=1 Tax=Eruca vesicaria subsp. sativa TaxID=29727 RepID=A0ABC8M4D6_ERUVS|nr:unnamed protein product [Eruca vesicaria subsp. sativa]